MKTVSVYNTFTEVYEDVEVTEEVYDILMRTTEDFKTEDALRKDEDRHSRNISRMEGADGDSWENFKEVRRVVNDSKVESLSSYKDSVCDKESFDIAFEDFKNYIKSFSQRIAIYGCPNTQYGIQIPKEIIKETVTIKYSQCSGVIKETTKEKERIIYSAGMSSEQFDKTYCFALSQLKEKDVELIFALFHTNLSLTDYAKLTGVKKSSVCDRKKRALKHLKKYFS